MDALGAACFHVAGANLLRLHVLDGCFMRVSMARDYYGRKLPDQRRYILDPMVYFRSRSRLP